MEAMEIDDNNVMEVVEMDHNDEMDNQPLNHEQNLDLVCNQVFGNHLILSQIFRNLNHLDILECRKVSRWWCQISTEILGNNGPLQFEYCSSLGCFIRTLRQIKDCERAESLQGSLLPSFWTPCINYAHRHASVISLGKTFIEDLHSLHSFTKLGRKCQEDGFLFNRIKLGLWGYGWLDDDEVLWNRKRDIEEFLSVHGSKVVELGMDFGYFDGSSHKFLSLLLRHMSNLEKLHVGIPVIVWGFPSRFPESSKIQFAKEMSHINLPKLKFVTWARGHFKDPDLSPISSKDHWSGDLLDVIKKSAPNLKKIVQIPCEIILRESQFIPITKISSCHQMIFNPIPENIGQYMKFANGRPQLSTIIFDLEKTREKIGQEGVGSRFEGQVNLCLRRILESSQLTLKKVKGRSQVESLECLRDLAPLIPSTSHRGNLMTSDDPTMENRPLPNSIMLRILNNLPASLLLKITRLVSRQWREISNQILIQRRSLQINFVYDPQHQRYLIRNPMEAVLSEFTEDLPTLYKFTGCVFRGSRCSDFPCIRFGFSNSPVYSSDLDEFCEMYGSKVQELELKLDSLNIDTGLTLILKLTQVQALRTPYLKVLTLVRDFGPNPPSRIIVSPIAGLRNLKLEPSSRVKSLWINQIREIVFIRGLKLEFREVDPATFTVDHNRETF